MFADETKLFRNVKSIDDCNILQNDLNIRQVNGLMIGKNNPKLEYTMKTAASQRAMAVLRSVKRA